MPAKVIIGSQWGDEGKGKITDLLASKADKVVRFQGGNNAGHTIVVKDEIFKLHLVPSGSIYGKDCMIASGVVVDPGILLEELDKLKKLGLDFNLVIDSLANIIMPYHKQLDALKEAELGKQKIGTTKKGIGPCYADRVSRSGIRFSDLLDPEIFKEKLRKNYREKRLLVERIYNSKMEHTESEIFDTYMAFAERLRSLEGDVSTMVNEGLSAESNVLFEGAQGTFLDVVYGTYPYVTSSHTISGGVFSNVGIPPMNMEVLGVVKAYTTRVGSGPFLTELNDKTGELIRLNGHEYGTTTGRARRCGWLDLVMLKQAHQLNGFTELALTKLDVLTGVGNIKVATKYMLGDRSVNFSEGILNADKCQVEYKEFDAFEVTQDMASYSELPPKAQEYVQFIEDFIGVKVSIVSVGPNRSHSIFRA